MRRLHFKQRLWLTSDSFLGAGITSLASATSARGIVLLTTDAGLDLCVSLLASLRCSPLFGSSSCAPQCTRSTSDSPRNFEEKAGIHTLDGAEYARLATLWPAEYTGAEL